MVEGVEGFCEPNGYCSFPDEECASGRRYGQMAPAEFAGVCVGESMGSTTAAQNSTLTGSTSAASTSTSTGSSSTAAHGSSTTTSGPETSSSTGAVQPQPNIVFVSSMPVSTRLGQVDVAQADADCNTLAAAEGLRGEFVAWLPDGDQTAPQRLGSARGWVRPDGRPFTDRVVDLLEGRVFYPPVLDEAGTEVRGRRAVTGTRANGAADFDCDAWQDAEGLMTVGSPGATVPSWTEDAGLGCTGARPLSVYCFGVDAQVPVSFEPESGRRAFVTDMLLDGAAGLDAMDAECAFDAAAARLPGTFLAVVATSGGSALSRFSLDGEPWVNMNGAPLSDTALSLAVAPHLDASPGLTAFGAAVGGSFWTGAVDVDGEAAQTCADWTSTTDSGSRFAIDETTDWFQGSSTNCAGPQHVLCFQE